MSVLNPTAPQPTGAGDEEDERSQAREAFVFRLPPHVAE